MHNNDATIDREAGNCSKAFQSAVKRSDVPSEDQKNLYYGIQSSLRINFERFEIWARNAGINRPSAVCLEERLKGKNYITDYILSSLRDLKGCLDKGKLIGISIRQCCSTKIGRKLYSFS